MNGFNRTMLLREAYEQEFSIFDHANDDTRPPGYALVSMNPKENLDEHGLLYNAIRRYHVNQMHKEFGIPLNDFLELPQDVVDMLYRALGETRERISAEAAKKAEADAKGQLQLPI